MFSKFDADYGCLGPESVTARHGSGIAVRPLSGLAKECNYSCTTNCQYKTILSALNAEQDLQVHLPSLPRPSPGWNMGCLEIELCDRSGTVCRLAFLSGDKDIRGAGQADS